LAFMRGRTLSDAFVILDEAQNTTPEQMKMFLTRLGFGSKAVITGDITQIDLPAGRTSGLIEAIKVVGHVDGIAFVHFDDRDVVRNKLVQLIVRAYDAFSNGNGHGAGTASTTA
ncbi:MAG: PhoH family protein, partial [Acidobacteriota bacterium]